MNFAGHNIGGIISAIGVTAYNHSEPKTALIAGVITYIFALYPDMDIRSTPRKILTPIGLILCALSAVGFSKPIIAFLISVITILPYFCKHRKFNHSLVWMFLVAGMCSYMIPGMFIPVIVGFCTHLLLDRYVRLI